MSIDLANESGRDVEEQPLVDVARFVLDRMRVNPLAELSILLVDPATMAQLNEKWMGLDGPTDVLAFPMDELRPGDDDPEPGLLGDVVLCPDYAAKQAREQGHDLAAELELLVTHGVLHLLGFDHADAEEEREMFGLQRDLLAAWGRERGGAAAGEPSPGEAAP